MPGLAGLVLVGLGGASLAAEPAPPPHTAVPSDLIPGLRTTYRTFPDAALKGRCERGEALVGAYCAPGSSPVLAEEDGTVATCRTAPFTIVCVR